MVDTTIAKSLSPEDFKRHFGVNRSTFEKMVEALQPTWRSTPKPGAKPKLGLSDRVLVALEYWREYRTYFHIGNIAVFKIVRTELNENGHSITMRKPSQKILLGDDIKCISDSLI